MIFVVRQLIFSPCFQSITVSQSRFQITLFSRISQLIIDYDNSMLDAISSFAEVKETIFYLDKSSVPGLGGFSGFFFIHCWDIISNDVFQAVCDFWAGVYIPKYFIVLLLRSSQRFQIPLLLMITSLSTSINLFIKSLPRS